MPEPTPQPAGPPHQPEVSQWLVACAVMLGTFMEVLDTSVANVSLSHIAGNLNATVEESTWVLTSYLVSNAIVLPLTGWLSGLFGRKRFFTVCLCIFTTASLLCGLAPTLSALVIFRILQGLGGGALQPISQAILLERFPPHKRGQAMAVFGVGVIFAPIIGPTVGGWITDNYSWHWIFLINIPVGILAITLTQLFVFDPHYIKRTRSAAAAGIDYLGLGLLALGLACLQIVLDKGQTEDWFAKPWIVEVSLVSAAALLAFIWWELRVSHPVVNLRLLRDRNLSAGTITMFCLGAVLYASLALLPIMLQSLLGYTAMLSGMVLSPRGFGALITMPIAGLLLSRVDARWLVATGMVVASGTLFAMSRFTMEVSYSNVVLPVIIQGFGIALVFVPLTTITFATISNAEMGNATGMFNLMRNLGGSVGIAVTTTLLSRFSQTHQARLVEHVSPYSIATQARLQTMTHALMGRGLDHTTAQQGALRLLYGTVQRQAAMMSFVDNFHLMGIVFLMTLPLVLIMKRPHRGKPAAGGH